MRHRDWFWGLFFVAAAVVILISQTVTFVAVGFWSILATVLLAVVFISSLTRLNFFGIFISAGLLYKIYQSPFHWPFISIWIILLVAVLASVGCEMIFHPHKTGWWNQQHGSCKELDGECKENLEGENVYAENSFSESCKYLHSDNLRKGHFSSSFGKLSIYFDQVTLSPEGAEIYTETSFGTTILYIPAGWRVEKNVRTSFGSVTDLMDSRSAAPDAPVLHIKGDVSFGELEIHPI
jgi:predicted membrane protein